MASGSSAHLARVEVPLKFDDDFFRLIQQDIASLEQLQRAEREASALSLPYFLAASFLDIVH